MATTKYATIRYHALDRCFSNPGKKFFMSDLVEACNEAIYDYTGTMEGIKERQVFDDIKFMESEQGWSIPLDRIPFGRKRYYRYSDINFSINKQAINENEARQLKETLSILTRFKGMPQFKWMEEMMVRIESAFMKKLESKQVIVGFDQNQYLKGLDHFSELFDAIQHRKALTITYQGFRQSEPMNLVIHPYYLKQYNSRWFLFGHHAELGNLMNLPLDRIQKVVESDYDYLDNDSVNFEEYFDDVIGVTVSEDAVVHKIIIEVANELWPYIESKPIHGSQKVKRKMVDGVQIELSLQINYELISVLFSLGENIKVVEPDELKSLMKTKAEKILQNYF